ncbi:MAG: sensor histidine kinase KdpD [Actinomycetales bacterium]|nr:sensor histidine kinase KdpD [Candidatus Phosphoribacter baldrii]HRC11797.1 DUF4118 domain-containing protein [Dermatophilaceae bacterium]
MARGRLRIYLGAAPGVGKTVAMLSEGARRLTRGTDVIVGVVETHGRPHTAAMLEGLEVVPRRVVEHRGATLTEMDLAAVLARRPDVVLVDELAHTNAPGSAHEKRWQDIDSLLAVGIDVISTVNIQHLESLNDAVEDITGIVQQETVPDAVVRAADQIELVDMSPEALRRRMAHGNVYKAEKVDAALSNYFRVGNLSALRELALLWLADRVDEGLDTYRHAHDINATWPTRERVVVAVSGGPESEALVRRGARIAARGAGGELVVLYVARSDGLAGAPIDSLAKVRRLTEEVGGGFHTISGEDRARAILQFARAENASTILIGASRRPWWRALLRPGVAASVIEDSGDIDVHVVTHSFVGSRPAYAGRAPLARRRVSEGYLWGLGAGAVLTSVLWLIDSRLAQPLGLPLIVQLYLLHTIVASLIGGMAPAVVTAVASSLAVNWFFTPPLGTLTISSPENALALALFVVVAALVSLVVHTSSRRAEAALAAQQESAALAELTHTLLGSTEQLALLLRRATDMFGVSGAAVVRHPSPDEPASVIACTDDFDLRTGANTKESVDGDHDLILTGGPVPAERKRLLAAYAAHAGAILARRALQDQARSAEHLTRDNRERTALLSAVSHDLRTPLAGIKAAIGSLRSQEVEFSAKDRAELEEAIDESADRLEALIDNLLDMSRLQVGALVAHPRRIDLGEVVPAAIRGSVHPGQITWSLGEGARFATADAGLLDRVLGNLVENAIRHHNSVERIRVTTSRIRDEVQLRVIDAGPGIPLAVREHAFQPFQRQTDSGGDGVGLGLAVARGLTEAMGGTLTAEDTPGGGLTMVVALPAGSST